MEMATDLPSTFREEAEDSCMKMVRHHQGGGVAGGA